jgi:hypothetical protein
MIRKGAETFVSAPFFLLIGANFEGMSGKRAIPPQIVLKPR